MAVRESPVAIGDDRRPGPPAASSGKRARAWRRSRRRRSIPAVALAVLAGAFIAGVLTGPAHLPVGGIVLDLLGRLPFVHVHSGLTHAEHEILWQIRLPRVVLGGIVGWMLAAGGAAYQGVFRNALADPYLLGAAAGAGLGATLVIAFAPGTTGWPVDPVPLAAFGGALAAVVFTWVIAASAERRAGSATIVLAGVAVAAFLTAIQTYVQQQHTQDLQLVYSWILGRLSDADWHDVAIVIPYVAVASVVLVLHGRLLDVLQVGEGEASSLGVDTARTRLVVIGAATLGTAAVVAVSGLIGFVGIIVPHTVRLTSGVSYRRLMPLAMVTGGAFLIAADLLARTLVAPGEIPIGVITAFFGAPFFMLVLHRRAVRA